MSALAEQLERYLTVRQHTLSTAHLCGFEKLIAEARYIVGEANELLDAVEGAARLWDTCSDSGRGLLLLGIRKEIADVTLADTTLAGMLSGMVLPGGWQVGSVTVEGCIAEKTEADRGRG